MARPRSEDKSKAILKAATAVFAERGLAAPTSAISKAAGIAEGTLFTYFPTKDELLNALYRSLKLEAAAELLQGLPPQAEVRRALKHLWDGQIRWALAYPAKYKVLGRLRVSAALTPESRAAGARPFAGLEALVKESVRKKVLRDFSFEFMAAMMAGLADATLAYIAEHPGESKTACERGFEVLWNGLALP